MRCEVPGEVSNDGATVRASHLDQPAALIHLNTTPAQHSLQSPDVGATLHKQLLMWMGITETHDLMLYWVTLAISNGWQAGRRGGYNVCLTKYSSNRIAVRNRNCEHFLPINASLSALAPQRHGAFSISLLQRLYVNTQFAQRHAAIVMAIYGSDYNYVIYIATKK